ncbi:MAG: DUF1800 family protein [Rudaea sp.]
MRQHLVAAGPQLAAFTLLAFVCVPALAYDLIFHSGFQAVADTPSSDAEAARFLTMATFGPTPEEIARLRGIGYSQWIEQQLAMPTTLERPTVETLDAGVQNPGQGDRREQWLKAVLTSPDQLRQRTAWALSQIMVVTDQGNKLGQDPVALAEYYDVLARDSFGYYDAYHAYHAGSYLNLLTDVTYSPAMAKMLTFVQNDKGNPLLDLAPDENYAREVMQLFSIGLIERNPDFSPIRDNAGNTISTYDQDVVTGNAHVFTGLSYDPRYSPHFKSYPTNGSGWTIADYLPMVCYEDHHDEAQKTVLGDQTLDNPAPNCDTDFAQLIGIIANHPNVAPFISRQLIQRFTSSNPSPCYIEHVSTVFSNTHGDFGAVVKAVITDPEAMTGLQDAPCNVSTFLFGKPREPVLKLTAFWRYYHAAAPDGSYSKSSLSRNYGQAPLDAPSVFNFYLPDYLPPGELADAGSYAPEFQIESESAIVATANDLTSRAKAYEGANGVGTSTMVVDLAALFALANDPDALVAQVNHDLLYGSMSSAMHDTLVTMVGLIPYTTAAPQPRVTALLQVVLASPEFSIQH